jgi:soluble cytochrome b562
MVNFPDTHITCSHCNAVVPWSLACINCGQKLPDKPLYDPINVRSRDDTVLFNIDVEEEPEGKLAKYLMYRVKLVEVAEKREISHEVFRELYQDYIFKTNELMEQYSWIGKQVTEAHKILLDTKRYLEEKKEEKAKNNITDEDFREEFERLKGIIETVQRSLVKLGEQQQEIGLGEKTEKDTKILNRIHQMCQYYRHKLPKLVEYSVVPEDMEGILAEDLDQVIRLFSDIDDIDEYVLETEIPDLNIQDELESQEEDPIFEDIKMVVKGHDEEIRRTLRAIRVQDHVLLLGSHGEGKTEMLRQLKNFLGGISYHCSGETGERELIAGYNPTASIGEDPVHEGVLVNVSKQSAPILFLDDVTDLGSSAQGLLIEALTDRTFTNPVDGQTYRLPKEFVVVASGMNKWIYLIVVSWIVLVRLYYGLRLQRTAYKHLLLDLHYRNMFSTLSCG